MACLFSRFLFMTQFAPIYARRAFPCFDEPSYQATFALSIAHPEHLVARATTPVSAISHTGYAPSSCSCCVSHVRPLSPPRPLPCRDANGYLLTTFETTPAMSPHSLSWLVTDMAFSGEEHEQVHTYGRLAVATHVRGLHASSKGLLQLLEEYTGVASPAKLDQVVVPQLDAAAVSSYGVLAYRWVR